MQSSGDSYRQRMLVIFFTVVLVVALVALVAGRAYFRASLFPLPKDPVPGDPPDGWFSHVLPISGVHLWGHEGAGSAMPVVLYFHGNGENLASLQECGLLDSLRDLDCPVVAVDYPGYGLSLGSPSASSLVESGQEIVDWAHLRWPARRVIATGWSLGAAVAVQLNGVDALVMISPWRSLKHIARAHASPWVVRLLVPDAFDSESALKSRHIPVLLIHGVDDPVIPIAHARALQSTADDARLIELPGVEHDVPLRRDAWDACKAWIQGLD